MPPTPKNPTVLPEGFPNFPTGSTQNLIIYACPLCGSAVIEYGGVTSNRSLHAEWHRKAK